MVHDSQLGGGGVHAGIGGSAIPFFGQAPVFFRAIAIVVAVGQIAHGGGFSPFCRLLCIPETFFFAPPFFIKEIEHAQSGTCLQVAFGKGFLKEANAFLFILRHAVAQVVEIGQAVHTVRIAGFHGFPIAGNGFLIVNIGFQKRIIILHMAVMELAQVIPGFPVPLQGSGFQQMKARMHFFCRFPMHHAEAAQGFQGKYIAFLFGSVYPLFFSIHNFMEFLMA